ncbi:MAG: zinc ribbon domain-containing protein [Candidatus Odinarchaeia archaeon]
MCHKCCHKGARVGSSFKCPNCGYSCHADYNGAMNILKRVAGYMSVTGAALTQPEPGMMKPLG